MKVNFNWIARMILSAALKKISTISTDEMEELTQKINARVNVPILDERQEEIAIRRTLIGAVQTARELLGVI